MAAKRSPILGYNHNVRYRGLVFHVQTEDSGVLSPHLFTHLFHGGVIVSTRKLVYDSGSAEETIKSLMQAQHKAVLKDLRKGAFDEKIDQYLGGTPGLLPRGAVDPEANDKGTGAMEPLSRDSEPVLAVPTTADTQPTARPPEATRPVEVAAPPEARPPRSPTAPPPKEKSGPVVVVTPPNPARTPSGSQPIPVRTITADRTSPRMTPPVPTPIVQGAPTVPNMMPPAPEGLDPPTLVDHASAVAAAMQNAKTRMDLGPPGAMPSDFQVDSSPEITMTLEVDDEDDHARPDRPRQHRDTEVSTPPQNVAMAQSDGIPLVAGRPTPSRPQDSAMPPVSDKRVGASALPPTKSVTRPPAVAVMSRPLSNHDAKGERAETNDSVEVYAPPPSNADPAPLAAERPGQYSLRRSKPVAVPTPPVPPPSDSRPNSAPIPSGLARPGQSRPFMRPNPTIQEPVGQSGPIPRSAARADSGASRPLRNPSDSSSSFRQGPDAASTTGIRRGPSASPPTTPDPDRQPEHRARTPTPARVAPSARTQSSGPSPVVMTRPAVIVGAPAKTTPPRVRKAREDEGRGFGQGLISEKSLDEVILAYLSEDAEDK